MTCNIEYSLIGKNGTVANHRKFKCDPSTPIDIIQDNDSYKMYCPGSIMLQGIPGDKTARLQAQCTILNSQPKKCTISAIIKNDNGVINAERQTDCTPGAQTNIQLGSDSSVGVYCPGIHISNDGKSKLQCSVNDYTPNCQTMYEKISKEGKTIDAVHKEFDCNSESNITIGNTNVYCESNTLDKRNSDYHVASSCSVKSDKSNCQINSELTDSNGNILLDSTYKFKCTYGSSHSAFINNKNITSNISCPGSIDKTINYNGNTVKVKSTCNHNKCTSTSCKDGYKCNTNGDCEKILPHITTTCTSTSCADGYECDSGKCVQKTVGCTSTSCAVGYDCDSGKCVKSSSGSSYKIYIIIGVVVAIILIAISFYLYRRKDDTDDTNDTDVKT